jgi:alcohol dehydrogenase, propanol-preferring
MRALRLHAPAPIAEAPLHVEDVPLPAPGAGQVRLRVHVCGVCHTDLHTVEGDLDLPRLPLTPGHQIVGTVEAVGEGVTHFALGDRVGVGWLYRSCGACSACSNGRENLCPNAAFTGLHADGGYGEYVVVEERFAYPLPEHFDDIAVAPLLCAGIIGFRSLRQSGIQPGERLGLYGFGASAHIAIQVARYWDCEVYVFTRGEEHRKLARELGAAWVGGAQAKIDAPLDASVIFAPAGWIVPLALGHVRPGGTVAINAIHMSPIPEMAYATIYGERVLRSVANFTRSDAVDFLRLAAEIPVRTEVEVFPLVDANDVLLRLKRSEIRGAAVLQVQA